MIKKATLVKYANPMGLMRALPGVTGAKNFETAKYFLKGLVSQGRAVAKPALDKTMAFGKANKVPLGIGAAAGLGTGYMLGNKND